MVRGFAETACAMEMLASDRLPKWHGDVERSKETPKESGYRLTSSSSMVLSHVAPPQVVPRLQVNVPRASSSKRASPQSPSREASSSKRPRLGLEQNPKTASESDGDSQGEDSEKDEEEESEEEDDDEDEGAVAPLNKRKFRWLTVDEGSTIAKKHFPPAYDQVRGCRVDG